MRTDMGARMRADMCTGMCGNLRAVAQRLDRRRRLRHLPPPRHRPLTVYRHVYRHVCRHVCGYVHLCAPTCA